MANKPIRINIHKSQLELVNRCLSASSLPTKAALFSHLLTLYSDDYLRRFGADGKPFDAHQVLSHQEPLRDDGKPPKSLEAQNSTIPTHKQPFVEIIED